MSVPLPSHPQLSGNYAPIRIECDATDLTVEGDLPPQLHGSLYRVGPNPQYMPTDEYHWFGGDGMIHAFHFGDGRVDYCNRWARTPKWELEHEAGRGLFGLFGNPMTSDPATQGKDCGVANTNMLWHDGRLMALEELHAPFELDPTTLESAGYYRFDGKLPSHMTAHPKVDPKTGELLFFSYFAGGFFTPDIGFHVADPNGDLVRNETFQAPYTAIVHDFAITDTHVIFPICPLTGSMERAMARRPAFAWEPELGTRVGIMERDQNVDSIRWFESDACFMFHPMNAWSDDGVVTVDVMQFEAAPLFTYADGTPVERSKSNARLCRWTFDLNSTSNTFKRTYLDDLIGEFPRIDERYGGSPYRHGFIASTYARVKGDQGVFNQITHFDLQENTREIYQVPDGDAVSEPVFVARAPDAAEGDGFLLATVFRRAQNRSDLIILDAMHIEAGPVATVGLDHRIPFGFHGCWRQAED